MECHKQTIDTLGVVGKVIVVRTDTLPIALVEVVQRLPLAVRQLGLMSEMVGITDCRTEVLLGLMQPVATEPVAVVLFPVDTVCLQYWL